jgi:hypothetical protein
MIKIINKIIKKFLCFKHPNVAPLGFGSLQPYHVIKIIFGVMVVAAKLFSELSFVNKCASVRTLILCL